MKTGDRLMKPFVVLLALFAASTADFAFAETPEEKGLAIASEKDRRDNGFGDFTAEMTMVLRNKHGQESRREMRNKTLEVLNDGDKSLVVFGQPRDVKGTALLNFSHKTGLDDQWLFLPALRRVKRISSANKSGSFMGSEFAYEDITSEEVEKYTYKWLRDEAFAGQECFVLERYPAYKNSGYTRQVVWMDKAEYRIFKIDYYDRKNSLLKTVLYKNHKKYLDQYWYPDEMFMENRQTGKSTLLIWGKYNFRLGLTDGDFNKNSLKRVR